MSCRRCASSPGPTPFSTASGSSPPVTPTSSATGGSSPGSDSPPRAMKRVASALATELARLAQLELRRSRTTVEAFPASDTRAVALHGGRRLVDFSSNDYLGLARHPAPGAAMSACAARTGAGSGASHLITGHGAEHELLEAELAAFTHRERARRSRGERPGRARALRTRRGRGAGAHRHARQGLRLVRGVRGRRGGSDRAPDPEGATLHLHDGAPSARGRGHPVRARAHPDRELAARARAFPDRALSPAGARGRRPARGLAHPDPAGALRQRRRCAGRAARARGGGLLGGGDPAADRAPGELAPARDAVRHAHGGGSRRARRAPRALLLCPRAERSRVSALYCEVSGRGRDLVLLHGWGLNLRVWDGLAGALTARFRVIAIDLPGHGRSDWDASAGTPAAQAWRVHETLAPRHRSRAPRPPRAAASGRLRAHGARVPQAPGAWRRAAHRVPGTRAAQGRARGARGRAARGARARARPASVRGPAGGTAARADAGARRLRGARPHHARRGRKGARRRAAQGPVRGIRARRARPVPVEPGALRASAHGVPAWLRGARRSGSIARSCAPRSIARARATSRPRGCRRGWPRSSSSASRRSISRPPWYST